MVVDLSFLVGFIYAAIELMKSGMKAFELLANDDQRNFVVRILAAVVGSLLCVALGFSALQNYQTLAGMIITGVGLGIASDLLHMGAGAVQAKTTQWNSPSTSTSVTTSSQGSDKAAAPSSTVTVKTTTPE